MEITRTRMMVLSWFSDHMESWNDYSICRVFISHRIATSLLSGSHFDDDEETRY